MIEHKHWRRKLKEGIRGQHIAIVGYSHYPSDSLNDSAQFTNIALNKFLAGDEKMGHAFFPRIQRYFKCDDRSYFWNRVHFFNLIPECFSNDNKFGTANSELVERAQLRFQRILQSEKPDKVFIFSRKGWRQCFLPLGKAQDRGFRSLRSNPSDAWGTYFIDGKAIRVCGFKHPLYANTEQLTKSVQEFLTMTKFG